MRTNCAAEAGIHHRVPNAHKAVLQPVRQGEDIKTHTVRYIDGDSS
jgi:hypothetical protein